MIKIMQKSRKVPLLVQKKQTRDMAAWAGLYGILRKKKNVDPLKWQRKIRKEWERKLQ